jgi:hypothetical protein
LSIITTNLFNFFGFSPQPQLIWALLNIFLRLERPKLMETMLLEL